MLLDIRFDDVHRSRSIDLRADQTFRWEIGPPEQEHPGQPPRPSGSPLRIAGAVVAGGGVAALIATAITGVFAQMQYDRLMSLCGAAPCPPERQDDVRTGEALVTGTNILLGVGLTTAIGGGLGLLFASLRAQPASAPRVSVYPLDSGGFSVGLTGRF
jgi:hypothetical protein